jgi:hypothetical protein
MEYKSWRMKTKIMWYDKIFIGAMIVGSITIVVILFICKILPLVR